MTLPIMELCACRCNRHPWHFLMRLRWADFSIDGSTALTLVGTDGTANHAGRKRQTTTLLPSAG